MTHEEFVQEVMTRTGLPEIEARRAIKACLQALAEGLSEAPARRVAASLASPLAQLLRRDGPMRAWTADSLLRRAAELEGVRLGMGVEHAEVVLQTIYAGLDRDTRLLLRDDLPAALIDAAAARPSYHPPLPRPLPSPRVERRMFSETSLARGRATSFTPMSEGGKEIPAGASACEPPPPTWRSVEAFDDDE